MKRKTKSVFSKRIEHKNRMRNIRKLNLETDKENLKEKTEILYQDEEKKVIAYRIKEKENDKLSKVLKRRIVDFREKEKLEDSKARKRKRKQLEVKEKEKKIKATKRTDVAYRENEKISDAKARANKRKNLEEKESEKILKATKRTDAAFRENEKVRDAKARANKRKHPEEKEKEQILKATKRTDAAYRENEKICDAKARANKRKNPEEKESEKILKATKRTDAAYRENEKIRDAKARANKRKNPEEKEKEKYLKVVKRKDAAYKENEKNKNVQTKRRKREDLETRIKIATEKRETRKKQNQNLFYSYRVNEEQRLKKRNDGLSQAKYKFIQIRKQTPKYVCSCCDGLFFENDKIKFEDKKFLEKMNKNLKPNDALTLKQFKEKVIYCNTGYLCKSCQRSIYSGKIPKLAINTSGLAFPDLPDYIKNLSDLSEMLVSPYLCFITIRELKPFSLNPQLAAKGSVINIPIEIDEMINMLPRQFNNANIIPIKLFRNLAHKNPYLYECVDITELAKAIKYLQNQELYKTNNIKIDEQFFNKFADQRFVEFTIDEEENASSKNLQTENKNEETNNTALNSILGDTFESEVNWSDTDCWDNNEEPEDIMVIDRNMIPSNDAFKMAPGQDKKMVSWLKIPHLDEFVFSSVYGGHPINPSSKVSRADRIKSEMRRSDRRCCKPRVVLFKAKMRFEEAIYSSVRIALRKTKDTQKIRARDILNKDQVENLIRINEGFKMFRQVRSSPAYWHARKQDLMAMLRQIGKPTWFFTLSSGEKWWPELLQQIHWLLTGKQISISEALELNDAVKSNLIRNDPITCVRYFNHKVNGMMQYLLSENGPFSGYKVVDYFVRVEFQMRGSPHIHGFLWLEDAPVLDEQNPLSITEVLKFIDQFTCCEFNEANPYVHFQVHKHTVTCNKGKKNKFKCRFDFPRIVMDKTRYLIPLEKSQITDDIKKRGKDIRNLMQNFYKSPKLLSFSNILIKLNINKDQYIEAVRGLITKSQILQKRTSLEVAINSYNPNFLIFEANSDLQYVMDEFSAAMYTVNYMAKDESGDSKFIINLCKKYQEENLPTFKKYGQMAAANCNNNLMGAQEASYHCLELPLCKKSRACVYINTSPKEERAMILKSKNELQKVSPDSEDILISSMIKKYSESTEMLQNICLADFVALFYNKYNIDSEAEDNCEIEVKKRKRPKIIRYRRYKLAHDPINYYRERVMLFLPWKNEHELNPALCKNIYYNNLEIIEQNAFKYGACRDDVLTAALDAARKEIFHIVEDEEETAANEQLPLSQQISYDLNDKNIDEKKEYSYICPAPDRVQDNELYIMMRKLNSEQREIVMHLLHCFKLGRMQEKIIMLGSAGTGKSFTIHTIYHLITNYFEKKVGAQSDTIKVLLTAYTGKAAFLIGGNTLHSTFALPVNQYQGDIKNLSADVANSIRCALKDVKLIIMDEISFIGSKTFNKVEQRMRQITGKNDLSFGGVAVLLVGDLRQLEPVGDKYIFLPPTKFSSLIGNTIWNEFQYHQLKQIERQKGDQDFITTLNNLAIGKMTDKDLKLLESRITDEANIPKDAIRLYYENKNVDYYNNLRISNHPGPEFIATAKDALVGSKLKDNVKQAKLEFYRNKPASEMGNLLYTIRLKIGIKYMLTHNIDISDGIVNGAVGILLKIEPEINEPYRLWLDFGDNGRVGRKARAENYNYIKENNIPSFLVPIKRWSVHIKVGKMQMEIGSLIRNQFPITAAEALTIHKSQGQTYENVCVDSTRSKRTLSRKLQYVAFSRATSKNGLFLRVNSKYKPPAQANEEDLVEKELLKLKFEKTLKLSYNNLKQKEGIVVAYHNVRSLNLHFEDILHDDWYLRCDVLIFSETYSSNQELFKFPNFYILYRSDSNIRQVARGVICFVRQQLEIKLISSIIFEGLHNNQKYHIDLFFICINNVNTYIISGYKSPHTPVLKFSEMLQNMFDKIQNSNSNKRIRIVMGDFNFNVHKENHLTNLLNEHGFKSVLQKELSTTIHNTQIDVIFADSSDIRAGEYESYFSDHIPIYLEITNSKKLCTNNNVEELLNYNYSAHKCSSTNNQQFSDNNTLPKANEINNYNSVITENEHYLDMNDIQIAQMFLSAVCYSGKALQTESDFIKKVSELLNQYNEIFSYWVQTLRRNPVHSYQENEKLQYPDLDKIYNLMILDIEMDGNCFYRAISKSIIGNQNYYPVIRSVVIRSVLEQLAIYQQILNTNNWIFETFENTITKMIIEMATDNKFANASSLYALSFTLQREIAVVTTTSINSIKCFDVALGDPIPIFLQRQHYSALLPVSSITSEIQFLDQYIQSRIDLRTLINLE